MRSSSACSSPSYLHLLLLLQRSPSNVSRKEIPVSFVIRPPVRDSSSPPPFLLLLCASLLLPPPSSHVTGRCSIKHVLMTTILLLSLLLMSGQRLTVCECVSMNVYAGWTEKERGTDSKMLFLPETHGDATCVRETRARTRTSKKDK